jgi:hypothetical protein
MPHGYASTRDGAGRHEAVPGDGCLTTLFPTGWHRHYPDGAGNQAVKLVNASCL